MFKYFTFLAIPNIPIPILGIFWSFLGTAIPWTTFKLTNSLSDVTLIYSIAAILGIVIQPIIGLLSDFYLKKGLSRVFWIKFGSIITGMSLIFWNFATTFQQFLIISSLSFIFINILECPYFSFLNESVQENFHGRINLWIRILAGACGILFTFLITVLWKYSLGSKFVFGFTASIFIVPYLFINIYNNNYKKNQVKLVKKQYLSLYKFINKEIIKIYLLAFFIYSIQTFVINFSTPFFVNHIGFNLKNLGYALTLMNVGGLLTGILYYKFMDKFNYNISLNFILIFLITLLIFCYFNVNSLTQIYNLYIFYFTYGCLFFIAQSLIYVQLVKHSNYNSLGFLMGMLNVFICLPQLIMINLYSKLFLSNHFNLLFTIIIIYSFFALIISLNLNNKNV